MPCVGAQPECGDMIEILRGPYRHWGIYVGDDYIIHLTSPDGSGASCCASSTSGMACRGQVKKEPLAVVAKQDNYWVNNGTGTPRPVEHILKDAEEQVGEQILYSLVFKNCEHFASKLRYGLARSKQVRSWLSWSAVSLVVAGCAVVVLRLIKTRMV